MDTRDNQVLCVERVVKNYITCGLTRESDKLMAISGIVSELKSVFEDEYIAGLWKKDLLQRTPLVCQNRQTAKRM